MKRRTNLDRALSIFAPVEGGEGVTALLLTANLFLLMTAYYLRTFARTNALLATAWMFVAALIVWRA